VKTLAAIVLPLLLLGCSTYREVARPTPQFPTPWDQESDEPAARVAVAGSDPKHAGFVVVLPFAVRGGGVDDGALAIAEEVLRLRVGEEAGRRGLSVLAPETMLAVLADNGVDPGKACEQSCALELARELKADEFVSTIVARADGKLIVFLRRFETRTGRQLGAIMMEEADAKALRVHLTDRSAELWDGSPNPVTASR
jgi:hypothetical protein